MWPMGLFGKFLFCGCGLYIIRDILVCYIFQLVKKEILAPIVHEYVPQTVDLAHVNTRTDRVAALQGGRVFIVPQVILSEYLLFHEDFNKD